MVSREVCESFLGEVFEARPKMEQEAEVTDTGFFKEEDIMGDLLPKVGNCNLAAMVETLTPSQRQVYDWVAENFRKVSTYRHALVVQQELGNRIY